MGRRDYRPQIEADSYRNQVMAACGNGSLRLFDLTLEVALGLFLDVIGSVGPLCVRLKL